MNRIKDVEEQLLAGHEELIKSLKFDGNTTGAEAAIKIVNAEKVIRANVHQDFVADGKDVKVAVTEPKDKKADAVDPNATLEEKIEAAWKKPETRATFNDDKEAFVAYCKADQQGLIKILMNKKKKEVNKHDHFSFGFFL